MPIYNLNFLFIIGARPNGKATTGTSSYNPSNSSSTSFNVHQLNISSNKDSSLDKNSAPLLSRTGGGLWGKARLKLGLLTARSSR